MRNKIVLLIFITLLYNAFTAFAENPAEITRKLALELAKENYHDQSAIEFRRLASSSSNSEKKAAYFWAAAYEYRKAGDVRLAEKMLDLTEDTSSRFTKEALLLRGENAITRKDWKEASFFMESIIKGSPSKEMQLLAIRRLSFTHLMRKDTESARKVLTDMEDQNEKQLKELGKYIAGKDKKPGLGGLLGIIPGLGYAYSGEYGNALRSLILNGIFIYGLIDTANHEQWGGFAALTFFELTWYTGSIYGGVDAAHRYNRERLEDYLVIIEESSSFSAKLNQVPVISLKFEF